MLENIGNELNEIDQEIINAEGEEVNQLNSLHDWLTD